MWNGSSGTLAEGNTFVNCQREIAFGLIERTPDDHTGGIIRSNFIYRDMTIAGDAAIGVAVGNVTTASSALFVNPSAGGLRLKPTAAAAIDRVTVVANCLADWEGESRPQGPAADVGADEYRVGAALSPPRNLRIIR